MEKPIQQTRELTLEEHARLLVLEGFGHDGAIMEFIKALEEVTRKD